MYILGINLSHHASICLLKDGEIVFYLENDRLSKLKERQFSLEDEILCLEKILPYTNYIDHIVFASFGKNRYCAIPDELIINHIIRHMNVYRIEYGKIHFELEHHLYHATNAFYSSNFEESAALVLDGGGVTYNDYIDLRESESMYYFSGSTYTTIKKHYTSRDIYFNDLPEKHNEQTVFSSSLSCGWIFNTLCHLNAVGEPGKVMGMSSYGNSTDINSGDWFSYDEVTDTWYTNNEEILKCYRKYSIDPNVDPMVDDRKNKFEFENAANVAKKAQEETKDHTIRLIKQLLGMCNTKNIVLSGGYFLNCVNNYEYLKEFPDVNFYVDPISHDGGIAIGAAKHLWHCVMGNRERYSLKTLYLG